MKWRSLGCFVPNDAVKVTKGVSSGHCERTRDAADLTLSKSQVLAAEKPALGTSHLI